MASRSARQTFSKARSNPSSAAFTSPTGTDAYTLDSRQSQSLPERAGTGREAQGNSGGGRTGGTTPGWALSLPHRAEQVVRNRRRDALDVYSRIGQEFITAYGVSVTSAMRGLIIALRNHQRLLVEGGLYTARELDDRVEQLQEHLKVGGDEGKTTMEDRFHAWLNQEES